MYLTANMLHYILVHVDVVQHALQLLHVVHSTCSSFVTVTVVTQIMKRCTHQGASLRTLYSDLLPGLPGTRTYMQYINSSSSDQLAQNLITMHFPSLNLFSHTFLHMTIFPIYLPDYEKNLSLQQIAIQTFYIVNFLNWILLTAWIECTCMGDAEETCHGCTKFDKVTAHIIWCIMAGADPGRGLRGLQPPVS